MYYVAREELGALENERDTTPLNAPKPKARIPARFDDDPNKRLYIKDYPPLKPTKQLSQALPSSATPPLLPDSNTDLIYTNTLSLSQQPKPQPG